MCIFRNKWTKFTPTQNYLDAVKYIKTVTELDYFLDRFQWTGEKGDVWQTPEQFLKNEHLDCDDFMRFTVDVLVRIIGIKEARGIIHSGYDFVRWGNKLWNIKCHAICVFPYQGKFGVFSNKQLYTGIDSYEDAGKILFVDGLKSQVVYNWQGKILSRRYKLIGVF